MNTYDHWKATNPQDEFLGPEPREPEDELPADWPNDDPQSMSGEADE